MRITRTGFVVALALGGGAVANGGAAEEEIPPCVAARLKAEPDLLESIERTNEGVKAINRRDYEVAVGKLMEATALASDNHTAWYNLGLANDQLKKYDDAARAYEQAVNGSGDDAMYRMKHGIALYKAVVAAAMQAMVSDEEVSRPPVDPNTLDLAGANLEPALLELAAAVQLEPKLFRAYYYVGKIRRHQGDAAATAAAFTKAIALGPREVDPYIALGELYRRWDYTDEAIKVFSQGVAASRGAPDELAELRFALGMAYFDRRDLTKAIEPFTAALDVYPDLHKARYVRGLTYYQLGEPAKAKQDLEAYVKVATDELTRSIATHTLRDLAAAEVRK